MAVKTGDPTTAEGERADGIGANPLPNGLRHSHKAGAPFPPPLVAEDRLGRSPSEEGGPPGIGLPVETGPPCISRRGKASECVNPSPERERGRGEGPGRRTEGSRGSAATA